MSRTENMPPDTIVFVQVQIQDVVLEVYLLVLFCVIEREMLFTDAPSFFLLVSEVAGN